MTRSSRPSGNHDQLIQDGELDEVNYLHYDEDQRSNIERVYSILKQAMEPVGLMLIALVVLLLMPPPRHADPHRSVYRFTSSYTRDDRSWVKQTGEVRMDYTYVSSPAYGSYAGRTNVSIRTYTYTAHIESHILLHGPRRQGKCCRAELIDVISLLLTC